MTLTPEQIRQRVESLQGLVRDNERAHIEEDSIWYDTLLAIATGDCEDPTECAKEALKGVVDAQYVR